jgi:hypothetical protein
VGLKVGLRFRTLCIFLLVSALQADRSGKNNTGNSNSKSRLKMYSSIVDSFELASGHRLYECQDRVNKKSIDI